jgi:twitching motility two-component system response regulator PilH
MTMSPLRTVLVVDDSAVERYHLKQLLRSQGYAVIEASSGDEALIIAKEQVPDLVLMDVVMPGKNGFQVTRQFSKDEALTTVPIIMCTSKDAETDRVWAVRQGAKGYLVKPIKGESLFALLEGLFKTLSVK